MSFLPVVFLMFSSSRGSQALVMMSSTASAGATRPTRCHSSGMKSASKSTMGSSLLFAFSTALRRRKLSFMSLVASCTSSK